jgi:taurine transport system permease protein
MKLLSKIPTPAFNILSVSLLVMFWWAGSRSQGGGFASPQAVLESMTRILAEGYMGSTLAESLAVSLSRVMGGFVVSGVIGVVLGLALGSSTTIRAIVNPWLSYGRCVPPLGYLALVVLWFGVGSVSKLVLLMLSGVPPIAIGTAAAVAAVRHERIQGARSLGLSRTGVLLSVLLPSALPGIITSLRIAFGAIFAALVGAEMVASSSGIAWMTITAVYRGDMPTVVGCILIQGIIALSFDALLHWIRGRLVPWAGRS